MSLSDFIRRNHTVSAEVSGSKHSVLSMNGTERQPVEIAAHGALGDLPEAR